jgi:hypothetical protein
MSKPFKMRGHELPGPNQRSGLKMLTEESMGTSDSDWQSRGSAGRERDKYYGRPDIWAADQRKLQRQKDRGEVALGATYDPNDANIDTLASGQDRASRMGTGEYSAFSSSEQQATDPTADATKKNVDVEVTVNGQKI